MSEKKIEIKKILKFALGAALLGGLIYFIARIVIRDWATVRQYEWNLNIPLLIGSILVGCAGTFVNTKVLQRVLKAFGGRVPFSRFAFLFLLSNFGKYIPGKVAQIAGFLVFMKREGVARVLTFGSMVVYQILLIVTAGILGILLAGRETFERFTLNIPFWIFIAIAAVGIIISIPPIMRFCANLALRILKREPVEFDLSFRDWAVSLLTMSFGWILYGLSFAMMAAGITDIGLESFPFLGGAFILAFTIGWMVFISPGGLGVREGVLLVFLTAIYPSGVAGLVATAGRIWILAVEAASIGIAALIFKFIGCRAVSTASPNCPAEKKEIIYE